MYPIILRQRISFSILVVDDVGIMCFKATITEESVLTEAKYTELNVPAKELKQTHIQLTNLLQVLIEH